MSERRGEVWQDEGTYAAEGQLSAAGRMTNRPSTSNKSTHLSDRSDVHVHRLRRARAQSCVSHCFRNSQYVVRWPLRGRFGHSAVEEMMKKDGVHESATTPLWLRLHCPARYHGNSCHG